MCEMSLMQFLDTRDRVFGTVPISFQNKTEMRVTFVSPNSRVIRPFNFKISWALIFISRSDAASGRAAFSSDRDCVGLPRRSEWTNSTPDVNAFGHFGTGYRENKQTVVLSRRFIFCVYLFLYAANARSASGKSGISKISDAIRPCSFNGQRGNVAKNAIR